MPDRDDDGTAQESAESLEPDSGRTFRSFVRDHPTLAATAVVIVVFVVRVLVIADGSLPTIYGLLTTVDPATLALSTLLTLYPTVLYVASVVALLTFVDVRREVMDAPRWLNYAPYVFALDLIYLSFSWWLVILFIFVLNASVPLLEDVRARRRGERLPRRPVLNFIVVGSGLITLVFTTEATWLPVEEIRLRQSESVVGYVLETESEWTSVLLDEDRTLLRVRTSDVLSRELCDNKERTTWDRRLTDVLGDGPPTYPKCSEA